MAISLTEEKKLSIPKGEGNGKSVLSFPRWNVWKFTDKKEKGICGHHNRWRAEET